MNSRSLALLGASLLISLATACGDDGNNNGSCGDGHTTGSEQCDDGNTTNGDGCSSTCRNETSGATCGDNTVDVATEQCDDGNTTNGDGCSSTCQNESNPALCGNGAINGTEGCDDGDTSGGDGCSATCTVETGYSCTGTPSVCTMTQTAAGTCAAPFNVAFMGTTTLSATLMGDTTTGTSQVGTAVCDTFPDEGDGNDKIYKFVTTDVRDVAIQFTENQVGGAIIRLLRQPCDLTTEIIEYTGAGDGCADIDGSGFLGYVNLPAGTYYLVVDTYAAGEEGPYEITVDASVPGCGNGVGNPLFEFCDDGNTMIGDGCNANCEVETGYNCVIPTSGAASVCHTKGCGDGVVDTAATTPEQCDDLNTTSGDRCSATCQLEFDTTEVEPNDTQAQAQALSAGDHIVKGVLANGTDIDLYTFTLAAPNTVTIETYNRIDGTDLNYDGVGNKKLDCTAADTVVSIFAAGADVTMETMGLARDDEDGDGSCSFLGAADSADNAIETGADPTQLVNLPAGTYTVRVKNFSNTTTTAANYLLDIKIGASVVTPVAPAVGDLKINEVMNSDASADTNCDTLVTGTNDEFIELVNVSNKTLNLNGVTVADSVVVRFTFGAATNVGTGSLILPPNKSIVVWAGGAPACAGVTNWFTPATGGQLGLNNDGDTVHIRGAGAAAADPDLVTTIVPDATNSAMISFNLSPDITGTTYALHNAVTGHLGDFTPGKKVDGSAF